MIVNCHQQSRLRGSLFVAIVLQCYIDLQRQCVSVKERKTPMAMQHAWRALLSLLCHARSAVL